MQWLIIEMAKLLTQFPPPPWQCDSQCVALASVKAGDLSHGAGLGTRILVSLAEPGPLPCVARLQVLSVLSVTHSQPQPIRVQHPGRVITLSQSESCTIMHWPMTADHWSWGDTGTGILASDWSRVIMWPVYWPLIGREWSRDLCLGTGIDSTLVSPCFTWLASSHTSLKMISANQSPGLRHSDQSEASVLQRFHPWEKESPYHKHSECVSPHDK